MELSVGPSTIRGMEEKNRELRGYPFLPDIHSVPQLYATEDVDAEEKMMWLHYHIPNSAHPCDWWVAELDTTNWTAFGYARLNGDNDSSEWGYVNLQELESINVTNRNGLVIVHRDLSFKPTKWRNIRTTL